MQQSTLVKYAAQLLRLLWNSTQPVDGLTAQFLRQKKKLSSEEKRLVSEWAFTGLRLYSLLEYGVWQAEQQRSIIPIEPDPKSRKFRPAKEERPVFEILMIFGALLLGHQQGLLEFSQIDGLRNDLGGLEKEISPLLSIPPEELNSWRGGFFQAISELTRIAQSHLTGHVEPELDFISRYWCVAPWIVHSWRNSKNHPRAWPAIEALAKSLWSSAPLTIRVNRLRNSRESWREKLQQAGLSVRPGALSPDALIFSERLNLLEWAEYQAGEFDIQDESSQLVAFAVSPEPGWLILDACAGAGGKALHLAALQQDRGQIVAADIEAQRLKEIPFRARRAGLRSLQTIRVANKLAAELPAQIRHLAERCDAVLVDAPCSSLGRARRNPMPKWRLTPRNVDKLADRQVRILQIYSKAVKPGGVLVYSTCSLLPQENEAVIDRFLQLENDFRPEPLQPFFDRYGIQPKELAKHDHQLTLSPDQYGSDGFFIARLRRTE